MEPLKPEEIDWSLTLRIRGFAMRMGMGFPCVFYREAKIDKDRDGKPVLIEVDTVEVPIIIQQMFLQIVEVITGRLAK